jgi:CO dehydrogenase nickel-insertion accessory protein CooC1
LDADSTNMGIHQALGFKKTPLSLIDYFGGAAFSGGKVTCPVDDPSPLPGATIQLNEIPNEYYSFNQKGLFLFQLGKIGDKGPGAGCDGPISKITRDLRVHAIGDQPVTLIDVKAGLEDSARGVITSMDWIITVVDPTITSIQIAKDIKTLISRIKAGELPATRHLENPELVEKAKRLYKEARIKESFVVLNKIKDEKTKNYVCDKLKEKELTPIGVIYDDASISLSWLEDTPLESMKANNYIMHAIEKLEKKLKNRHSDCETS